MTALSDGRLGVEGGASTLWYSLQVGDLGAVWRFPTAGGGLALLPRVGLSVSFAGGAVVPGIHLGLSALVAPKGRLGLRLDYTWRVFLGFPAGISGVGVGVVVPLGARPSARR